MIGLNLSQREKMQRPASAFPERADIYLCDNCKRDITRHFSPGKSHSGVPMGRETYTCDCGREYQTGAVEWDHLSKRERHFRIRQTHGLGTVFSAMVAVPAAILYVLSVTLFHWKGAGLAALLLSVVPFITLAGTFWLEVAASKWRTRSHLNDG